MLSNCLQVSTWCLQVFEIRSECQNACMLSVLIQCSSGLAPRHPHHRCYWLTQNVGGVSGSVPWSLFIVSFSRCMCHDSSMHLLYHSMLMSRISTSFQFILWSNFHVCSAIADESMFPFSVALLWHPFIWHSKVRLGCPTYVLSSPYMWLCMPLQYTSQQEPWP